MMIHLSLRKNTSLSLISLLWFFLLVLSFFFIDHSNATRTSHQFFKFNPNNNQNSGHFYNVMPKRFPIPASGPSRKHNEIGLQSWRLPWRSWSWSRDKLTIITTSIYKFWISLEIARSYICRVWFLFSLGIAGHMGIRSIFFVYIIEVRCWRVWLLLESIVWLEFFVYKGKGFDMVILIPLVEEFTWRSESWW